MTSVYVETKLRPMRSCVFSLKKHLTSLAMNVTYMRQADGQARVAGSAADYTQDGHGSNSDQNTDSTTRGSVKFRNHSREESKYQTVLA